MRATSFASSVRARADSASQPSMRRFPMDGDDSAASSLGSSALGSFSAAAV